MTVHFFNDTDLGRNETNVFTREKMVEGFLDAGEEVVVYYPGNGGEIEPREGLELRPVKLPFTGREGFAGSVARTLFSNRLLELFYLKIFLTERDGVDYIWGRQPVVAKLLSGQEDFILEMDDYVFGEKKLRDMLYIEAASRAGKISTVSGKTRDDLVARGIDGEKIEVLPNAVDPGEYTGNRLDLGEEFVVCYTGGYQDWKGVETLLEAVEKLGDAKLVLTGDPPGKLVEEYSSERIEFTGFLEREKIPLYQQAADLLVLPNTAEDRKSRLYTSPVKLREYLASGTPALVADVPSTSGFENVTFFQPDDPEDLAGKIDWCIQNYSLLEENAAEARDKALDYTWSDRADSLLDLQ